MAVFNDRLYAGTMNPITGFQLWRTDAAGDPPYTWTRVLVDGAQRGNLNEGVVSMCVFKDALYVGTGVQNGGYDVTYQVGPAAGEVIRVHPDDSWDLVVGTPRRTRQGRKAPLSGLSPGFGNFFNGYIWRMREHAGRLYAGTCNWSTFLPFTSAEANGTPARRATERRTSAFSDRSDDLDVATMFNRLIHSIGPNEMVSLEGGFDLWSTEDGRHWIPSTMNGFGNPYNYGVRTLVSTPHGFFVGTANPFGPDIATRTPDGWRYRPNPAGGAEVWLAAATPSSSVPTSIASPQS